MTILLFLFGVAVAAGLFFILADILKLPRLSTEKALLSAGRTEKTRMKSLDALFLGWAIKLSKYIRMDEYKRHRLERTLNAAGMDMTPEVYLAYTILKPAAALLSSGFSSALAHRGAAVDIALLQGEPQGGGNGCRTPREDRGKAAPLCCHSGAGIGRKPRRADDP